MSEIKVIDTTLRDAHQCLWATRMTTAHMLPVAGRMDRIGFQRIDLAGTIQFDVCVRYLKENPWERVRLMRQRITETPLSSFTRSKNLVSFDVLPDDIVALWVERLIANGFREVGSFDGLNDVDNMLVTLDVPFAPEAASLAVESAVESGQPLLVVNVAPVPILPISIAMGYEYAGTDEVEQSLREYVGAQMLLEMLRASGILDGGYEDESFGHSEWIFDLSAGYDLKANKKL